MDSVYFSHYCQEHFQRLPKSEFYRKKHFAIQTKYSIFAVEKINVHILMKVYHGGYMAIEMPKILKSRFPKDFGKGFYCTELEEQAIRWASRYDTAVVSIYEYTPKENLKTLVFEKMTEEWLDFIVACRSGRKHNFDVVIGAMANDQIYNYISDFIDSILTREQFWVLAKFKHPTHQICFCSEKALKTLQFIDYKKNK